MEAYEMFEYEFGKWACVKNVVACASGTAALHLALEAMGLNHGRVLVPDFGMIACPRACSMAGLQAVFVDCDKNLLMDAQEANEQCGRDVVAMMPVHIYGRRCNMRELRCVSSVHGLKVIEDMSEAHGVPVHPDTDAACWSFYRNKIVAGEEGGAIAFKDPQHAEQARRLRSLGFTESHDFMHYPRGHNYRMSNCHSRLITDSLRQVDKNLAIRRRSELNYDKHCPDAWKMPPRDVVWVYDIRIPGLDYERQGWIVKALQKAGWAARHAFKPMSIQPEYYNVQHGDWQALTASKEVIYLPVWPLMEEEKCKEVFDIIRSVAGSV